jgi:hypothetical protein
MSPIKYWHPQVGSIVVYAPISQRCISLKSPFHLPKTALIDELDLSYIGQKWKRSIKKRGMGGRILLMEFRSEESFNKINFSFKWKYLTK